MGCGADHDRGRPDKPLHKSRLAGNGREQRVLSRRRSRESNPPGLRTVFGRRGWLRARAAVQADRGSRSKRLRRRQVLLPEKSLGWHGAELRVRLGSVGSAGVRRSQQLRLHRQHNQVTNLFDDTSFKANTRLSHDRLCVIYDGTYIVQSLVSLVWGGGGMVELSACFS